MPTVTFRLSDDELAALHQRARSEGKSLSLVVREALRLSAEAPDVVGRLEDLEGRLERLEQLANY